MRSPLIVLFILLISISCKKASKDTTPLTVMYLAPQKIEYASGFTIQNKREYKEIKVTTPWPDAKEELVYILHPKGTPKPAVSSNAIFIEVPIERVVVTSTTDIPMLEYMNLEQKLVGFPNTGYISSEKTRALIDNGAIKELGKEYNLNTEVVLELSPELVIGFTPNGDTKAFDLIQKTGIPVVMNGSWMEKHPLGRAEWIKFIAAFFGKEKIAEDVFQNIKKEYLEATTLAQNTTTSPTVLSGSMFKDVWHVPGGDSFIARFLKDAHTTYLWADTKKAGSMALSFESVLEKAKNAELWIDSGSSKSLSELKENNHQYPLFSAFKNKAVYSSSLKTGSEGGLIYYELGPMRPDLILKDIIKIAHPELLTNYEPYFFKKLN
ncbi:ABC transporter substrate-binding protein [Aquimarina sediminis]|uniref:ABC transporter substrate-binding protein n=1 Tax=Aquimarina sediminis TaxID=2070536 RepID=UPI000CA0570F|nr:ABC transporter substrate-binding protein [Aquimarina sediminis]